MINTAPVNMIPFSARHALVVAIVDHHRPELHRAALRAAERISQTVAPHHPMTFVKCERLLAYKGATLN